MPRIRKLSAYAKTLSWIRQGAALNDILSVFLSFYRIFISIYQQQRFHLLLALSSPSISTQHHITAHQKPQ